VKASPNLEPLETLTANAVNLVHALVREVKKLKAEVEKQRLLVEGAQRVMRDRDMEDT